MWLSVPYLSLNGVWWTAVAFSDGWLNGKNWVVYPGFLWINRPPKRCNWKSASLLEQETVDNCIFLVKRSLRLFQTWWTRRLFESVVFCEHVLFWEGFLFFFFFTAMYLALDRKFIKTPKYVSWGLSLGAILQPSLQTLTLRLIEKKYSLCGYISSDEPTL